MIAPRQNVQTHDRTAYYGARYLGQLGQSLYLAALFLVAGSGTSAPLGVSGVLVATMVAAVVLGLPGGALADRLGPSRGFALGACLRLSAIVAGLAFIEHPSQVWIVALLYSAGSQVFSPSEMALVPVIQAERPARAHCLLVGLQYAGQGTGLLILSPLLYFLGGPRAMLVGAGIGYVGLVALTLFLALRLRHTQSGHRVSTRRAFAFGQTLRFFTDEPRATYAVGLMAFAELATKCIVVALPLYLAGEAGLSQREVGALFVPGLIGAGIGLLGIGHRLTLDAAYQAMRLALAGTVLAVLALALLGDSVSVAAQHSQVGLLARLDSAVHTPFLVALPAALLLGLCWSVAPVGARAILTGTAPAGQQSRVFASQATLCDGVILAPLILAGAGAEFAGPRITLVFVGVLGLIVLWVLENLDASRRSSRPVPAPVLSDASAA